MRNGLDLPKLDLYQGALFAVLSYPDRPCSRHTSDLPDADGFNKAI